MEGASGDLTGGYDMYLLRFSWYRHHGGLHAALALGEAYDGRR
jgi:hypothetical protein